MTESFAELFEESLKSGQSMQPGDIVEARVITIKPDVVIVDAGLKSEGVIPLEEFKNSEGELTITEGDAVEVALEALEDGFGETRLSKDKAERIRTWDRLGTAFEAGEIITGTTAARLKVASRSTSIVSAPLAWLLGRHSPRSRHRLPRRQAA